MLTRHWLKRCGALWARCSIQSKLTHQWVLVVLVIVVVFLYVILSYLTNAKQYITVPSLTLTPQYEVIKVDNKNLQLFNTLNQVNDLTENEDRGQQLPEDLLVIYNRVPKTGSTSFMGIVYDMCTRNGFHVMHLNTSKNSHLLSLSDQVRYVWNITRWTRKQPAFIHGHLAYLNFAKYGLFNPKPLYINVIRRPLDRLVSYYYFLRNGDNFRPNLVRKKQGDKRSFDECVEMNGRDCRVDNLWLQIPFFCGHDSECWKPGKQWALEQAKRNLLDHYFLVGVTEQLHEFIQLLEAALPQMFSGATALYEKGTKSHLRQTFNKAHPSARTIAQIQQSRIWQMENEFYQFALDQFNFIRDKTLVKSKKQPLPELENGFLYKDKGQQFFYEKIRPKNI